MYSPLSSAFPSLYHLSSLKNCLVSDVLVWSGNSVSFSSGFRRAFSNEESTNVTFFLSLIDGLDFRLGRRDVRVWSPNSVGGFSCKSFFRILVNHSSVVESVFVVLWSLKILKKVRLFVWQVLLGFVNSMDKVSRKLPSLMVLFTAFFVRRQRKTWITLFGCCLVQDQFGSFFFAGVWCFISLPEEHSHDDWGIPPSPFFQRERAFPLGWWVCDGVCDVIWVCGVRNNSVQGCG